MSNTKSKRVRRSADQWAGVLSDQRSSGPLANAILDRLMHSAHQLNLKGESMRKKQADLTNVNT